MSPTTVTHVSGLWNREASLLNNDTPQFSTTPSSEVSSRYSVPSHKLRGFKFAVALIYHSPFYFNESFVCSFDSLLILSLSGYL